MKKILCLVAFVTIASSNVFATTGQTKITDTTDAISAALADFSKGLTTEEVQNFKGVKGYPKSHGVSVKVFLVVGETVTYGCHRHTNNDPIECHLSH